jgi:hypothetical protein
LSPLEIGFHCLRCETTAKGGRGKKGGLSAYAGRVGKGISAVSECRAAAIVLEEALEDENLCVDARVFLEKVQHLAAIHALPKTCWPACVEWLSKNEVAAVQSGPSLPYLARDER